MNTPPRRKPPRPPARRPAPAPAATSGGCDWRGWATEKPSVFGEPGSVPSVRNGTCHQRETPAAPRAGNPDTHQAKRYGRAYDPCRRSAADRPGVRHRGHVDGGFRQWLRCCG
ncbi:hypothetical protein B8W67_03590 [Mycolicibacillus koreensis]|uniref:Uncharacterized protein n=1 Tax=Mycolicibacillus koreensis TaxID=1069220 RepID=A0AA91PGF2_9MYCO|nr:hypothetical protein B8W67_03590 [Mycolicibacillus koreensis]